MADAPAALDARPADAFSSERRLAIVRLVDAQGRVRVGALSDRFGVSRQTIRKDLAVLAAQGRISIPPVLGAIAAVALIIDFGWYELGRRRGDQSWESPAGCPSSPTRAYAGWTASSPATARA